MKRAFEESKFDYKGFTCVVIFQGMGHRCGYVAIPKGHPLFNVDYECIDVDCHGGLTYAASYLYGQEDNPALWWIGFDCAHYMDGKDFETARKYFSNDTSLMRSLDELERIEKMFPTGEVVRTLAYVEQECRNIVDQLIAQKGEPQC
jgi:hypothetical protein